MRWPKSLYYQMGGLGWFTDKRVELIEGEIIETAPMGTAHLNGVGRASRAMFRAFGDDFLVMCPGALDLGTDTEPEPDIVVARLAGDGLASKEPSDAALVIEVADSSLRYDRTTKAALYASAEISDYWIVNLNDRTVVVHRSPQGDDENRGTFNELTTYREGEWIEPLALPGARIAVSDLLPPTVSKS